MSSTGASVEIEMTTLVSPPLVHLPGENDSLVMNQTAQMILRRVISAPPRGSSLHPRSNSSPSPATPQDNVEEAISMSGILAAIDHLDEATVQFNELYARVGDEGAIGTYNNIVGRLEVGLENERLTCTGRTNLISDEPEWSEAEFKVRQLVDDYILISLMELSLDPNKGVDGRFEKLVAQMRVSWATPVTELVRRVVQTVLTELDDAWGTSSLDGEKIARTILQEHLRRKDETGHAWLRYVPLSWDHNAKIKRDEGWLEHGG